MRKASSGEGEGRRGRGRVRVGGGGGTGQTQRGGKRENVQCKVIRMAERKLELKGGEDFRGEDIAEGESRGKQRQHKETED